MTPRSASRPVVRTGRSDALASRLAAFRGLMDDAFDGDFSDEDWQHALGGTHAWIEQGGEIACHGSVVPRELGVGAGIVAGGYVEAVATLPRLQGRGLGTAVMIRLGDVIRSEFAIGALSTPRHDFYGRLGWLRWQGPSYVRHRDGRLERTPDEDAGIMVLPTERSPPLNVASAIVCDARQGDHW